MDAVVKHPAVRAPAQAEAKPTRDEAEAAVRTLLAYIGENPDREGLRDTPRRVVRAYDELYGGYGRSSHDVLQRVFDEVAGYNEMVVLRDIPFTSHCEHHMLPFTGKVHVAYYPSEGVVGLSKIARVIDIYARRLQTQEHLTAQISRAIDEGLKPRGTAVLVEAQHSCMWMRGIQKGGVSTVTQQFTGVFQDSVDEQQRFLDFVRHGPR